jgi:hypothetical protein
MTSQVDFSTGDIWRAASDKSPFHRGSEARHRRAWKGLWKVYGFLCEFIVLFVVFLD